ncbi:hypothetical protein SEUCBS140593_003761 [Sporothrix eucalyptigena]|uniref:Uncharacterized protein n=1 Tax=Sporothrix eucalyptigena TaxID=1812306 RepID=A0ABP0BHT2_9PEZI
MAIALRSTATTTGIDRGRPTVAAETTETGMPTFEPLFAHYLDQEKNIPLADLESDDKKDSKKERELQSRWRRFVDKWNGHELDDHWYEPQLFLRAVRAHDNGTSLAVRPAVDKKEAQDEEDVEEDDDDSDYGPALPPGEGQSSSTTVAPIRSRHLGAPGPAIPSLADLEERRAVDDDERDAERAALRLARRADRAEQRERLGELVPRAAAGTRERQLEKKRELNDKMRGFRDRSPGGGGLEVGDDELMGDDGGGGSSRRSAQDVKKEAEAAQARRTYWQQRREEEQRARDEELNERRAQYRAREEETMDMLRELARQRFG